MSAVLPAQLSGRPVELRCWAPEEASALRSLVLANLEHLRPWMPWIAAEPTSVDERLQLIETWERERVAGGDVVYGVFLDGAPIGGCGLQRRIGPGGLEIGYWIDQGHVRRGYAVAAARLLTEAALAMAGIERVEIHHDRANVASAGVPRRLGYAFVGEQPHEIVAPGQEGVQCIWRITDAAWRPGGPAAWGPGGLGIEPRE